MADPPYDQSRWMTALPSDKKRLPLSMLAIPGSHDAFAYDLRRNFPLAADAKRRERDFVKNLPFWGALILSRWSQTQTQTPTQQLKLGIRYFDLRVQYYRNKPYIVHKFFGPLLIPLLTEMNTFLNANPGEVILLDFQHLYGMSSSQHTSLARSLQIIFGDKLAPRITGLSNATLEKMATSGYQVIVIYQYKSSSSRVRSFFRRHPNLWQSSFILSPWGNKQSAPDLIPYLQSGYNAPRNVNQFYVHQAVLTPDSGILARYGFTSTLLRFAAAAAPSLLEWVATKKPTPGPRQPGLNIMMTDAVEVGGIAKRTIDLNTQPVAVSEAAVRALMRLQDGRPRDPRVTLWTVIRGVCCLSVDDSTDEEDCQSHCTEDKDCWKLRMIGSVDDDVPLLKS